MIIDLLCFTMNPQCYFIQLTHACAMHMGFAIKGLNCSMLWDVLVVLITSALTVPIGLPDTNPYYN